MSNGSYNLMFRHFYRALQIETLAFVIIKTEYFFTVFNARKIASVFTDILSSLSDCTVLTVDFTSEFVTQFYLHNTS